MTLKKSYDTLDSLITLHHSSLKSIGSLLVGLLLLIFSASSIIQSMFFVIHSCLNTYQEIEVDLSHVWKLLFKVVVRVSSFGT